MAEHNDPENFSSKFTKKFSGKWILLHQEQYPDRAAAVRRERELNTGKGRDWLKEHVLPHD